MLILIISSQLPPGLPSGLCSSVFPTKTPHAFLFSFTRVAAPPPLKKYWSFRSRNPTPRTRKHGYKLSFVRHYFPVQLLVANTFCLFIFTEFLHKIIQNQKRPASPVCHFFLLTTKQLHQHPILKHPQFFCSLHVRNPSLTPTQKRGKIWFHTF